MDCDSGWTASNAAMAASGSSARYTPSSVPPTTSGMDSPRMAMRTRLVSRAASATLNPRNRACRSPVRSRSAPSARTVAR